MTLSILVPVLDDAPWLRQLLGDLQPSRDGRNEGPPSTKPGDGSAGEFAPEIIVIDGGSRDDSAAVARQAGVLLLERGPSRGGQLDDGARAASGEWLWFLHADSRVSRDVLNEIRGLCEAPPAWGRFDVKLADTPLLRLVAWAMNWRSAITGICTGDQGLFVHRSLLDAVGGVPRQPLMEDIELSKRLKRLCRPVRIRAPIHTSARRWHSHGVLKTVLLMWWLRFRYLCSTAPDKLAQHYYG